MALAILTLLSSVAVAAFSSADIASLAGEGLALVASAIFPALVLGLYWRRFGAVGAVAALLAGFLSAAIYIFGVRLAPVALFDLTGHLSTAAPSAVRKLADLRTALDGAIDPTARAAAQGALYRHALTVANWWGLKPAACVLFALPISLLAGIAATLVMVRPGTTVRR